MRQRAGALHCGTGCIVLLTCLALGRLAEASLLPNPSWLEYRIAWNGIPAALATVEVASGELAGRDSLVVEAKARTNVFVDLFWRFRGTARGILFADGLIPLHFAYNREMAGRSYETRIDFDAQRARGIYIRGDQRRELEVDGTDVIDPITAIFRARLSDVKPGDILRYDVWTGEARYRVHLAAQGLEQIDVPAGRFTALKIVPEVWRVAEAAEPDARLRRATIWVADDPAHTLLRIRSEIFIGAITIDLIKIRDARVEDAPRATH